MLLKYLLPVLFLLLSFHSSSSSSESPPPSAKRIEVAIEKSANYLMHQVKENGKFVYRINTNPAVKIKDKYNILRHAGAIYALSSYYQKEPSAPLLIAIERATGYLKDKAIRPLKENPQISAIWSKLKKGKHYSKQQVNNQQAKLGGTGLGLVALLSMEDIKPGFTSLSDLQALGRFIVFMQKEKGSFYSKYIPQKGGRNDDWTSLYYPGEAALGLLMLYEKDPSELWLDTATKALLYLAKKRKNSKLIPADHWALLATEKLFSIHKSQNHNNQINEETERLLLNHAIQICESILAQQVYNPSQPIYNGGFSPDGRTTPTATRLEGLLATLTFLPQEHRLLRARIYSAVNKGIEFLLHAQITQGSLAGAIPRAIKKKQGNHSSNKKKNKKFNRRSTEVRIDYVQHSLSAWLQYSNLNR